MYVLTFDIEDWYLSYHSTQIPVKFWDSLEYRTERNTNLILEFLNQQGLKATFFFLGYEVKKNPALLRRVQKEGHEMGYHGMYHVPPYISGREKFRMELQDGLKMMRDVTGEPVVFFRAPEFSWNSKCEWLPEVLAEEGILVDSSAVSGILINGIQVPHKPFLWEKEGLKVAEFPLNRHRIPYLSMKYSGSGFLRLYPNVILHYFFSASDYHMLYFHPRDFDSGVPMSAKLPWYRNIMNRIGNASTIEKLSSLALKFPLTSLGQAYNQWKKKNAFQ